MILRSKIVSEVTALVVNRITECSDIVVEKIDYCLVTDYTPFLILDLV